MPFTDEETQRHLETLEFEFWVHRRPPLHLRDRVREGRRIQGQSIELYFACPALQRPAERNEEPVAKLK